LITRSARAEKPLRDSPLGHMKSSMSLFSSASEQVRVRSREFFERSAVELAKYIRADRRSDRRVTGQRADGFSGATRTNQGSN